MKQQAMVLVAVSLSATALGCGGNAAPCTTTRNTDGTVTLSCPGSADVVIRNGMDGTSVAIRSAVEPAGTHCAEGGIAVEVGPDTNGNGTLDDGEVTSTQYVCNGANGAVGADGMTGAEGVPTLLATADEPAGTHCPDGGIVVTSGPDSDRSGVLEAGEVTSTSYVCNGANGSGGTVVLGFPTATSTLDTTFDAGPLGAGGGGAVFVAGGHVEETLHDTGVSSLTSLHYQFDMDDETGSFCTVGTLSFDISVNGTVVDTYSYVGGTSRHRFTVTGTAHFEPIAGAGAGQDYTVRIQANETVCGGGGAYNWYAGGAFVTNP